MEYCLDEYKGFDVLHSENMCDDVIVSKKKEILFF